MVCSDLASLPAGGQAGELLLPNGEAVGQGWGSSVGLVHGSVEHSSDTGQLSCSCISETLNKQADQGPVTTASVGNLCNEKVISLAFFLSIPLIPQIEFLSMPCFPTPYHHPPRPQMSLCFRAAISATSKQEKADKRWYTALIIP